MYRAAAKETKIISTYAILSIVSVIQFYIIVLFVHIIVLSTSCFCWHHYFVWFTLTLIDWPNFHRSVPYTLVCLMRFKVIAAKRTMQLALGFTFEHPHSLHIFI